jgi:CopG antitoxin of type II toxin-antitoxin system
MLPRYPESGGVQTWHSPKKHGTVNSMRFRSFPFPHLKPSLRTISLPLPVSMIEQLKMLANKRDVLYQSLLKVFLAERLEKERRPINS